MDSGSNGCADESKSNVRRRLAWLVVAHVVLPTTALLGVVFPLIQFLPALWAIEAVRLGSLLTLAFWVGQGTPHIIWRLLATFAATCYLAIWPTVAPFPSQPGATVADWVQSYRSILVPYMLAIFVLGCIFKAQRGRYVVARVAKPDEATSDNRMQFSVLSLLVVSTLVAVVLAFIQAIRRDRDSGTSNEIIMVVFCAGVFVGNTAFAVRSALLRGHVLGNVLLSLLVSVLLGVAWALAAGHDTLGWPYFVGGVMTVLIPTLIVIFSLLVIRSCGFRLVPRQSSPATPAT